MRGTNCGRQEASASSGQSSAHAPDHCERLRSKAGWSLGYVSAVDSGGRTIWIRSGAEVNALSPEFGSGGSGIFCGILGFYGSQWITSKNGISLYENARFPMKNG